MYKQTYYERRKNQLRDEAIDWQSSFNEKQYTWGEVAAWNEYFYKYAKKYGLVREFRENGII